MAMYSSAQFEDVNIQPLALLCNNDKEIIENKKIFNRTQPLDKFEKKIILNPRMISTSKCNLVKYNMEAYVFPPKTEILIKKNETVDQRFCHQNFVNVDKESYLLNINKKLDNNINQNINNELLYSENSLDQYYNTNLNKDNFIVDQPTKRVSQKTLTHCDC
jgi:hypothetical protein